MSVRWMVGIGVLCAAGLAVAAEGEKTAGLSEQERQEGFVALFNGKDLDGWQGSTDGYVVEDGLLVCKEGGGTLFTTKEYADFVFRFEFKLEPAANNGVGIRTPLGCNPAVLRHGDSDPRHRVQVHPAVAGARIDLRRCARQDGIPQTGRPVEQRRNPLRRPPRYHHAQRRGDRRRQSRRA